MLLTYFKIITGILSERSPVVTQLIRKRIAILYIQEEVFHHE